MKKDLIFMVVVLLIIWGAFLTQGCSIRDMVKIQVVGDEQINPFLKIATRRITDKIIERNPDKLEYIRQKCDEILATNIKDSEPILIDAVKYAVENFSDDPELTDDITSLIKFYGIDVAAIEIDLDMGQTRKLMDSIRRVRDKLK